MSFSVEVPDVEPAPRAGGRVVGVDVGITDLAVLSTGEHVPNPRRLDGAPAPLRRVQRRCARRRGPDRRTRVEPSNRWRKARARADRIHTQVAAQRRDHLHKLTTRLVAEHDTIVIEDLAVANMLRNRAWPGTSPERRGRDAAPVDLQGERRGVRLIVADRWFASSKTCSGCGTAKAKLALSERTYVCTTCGLVLDRDENAARNLAALAAADTGELRRELPDWKRCQTGRGRTPGSRTATGRVRASGQRHHREAVAR